MLCYFFWLRDIDRICPEEQEAAREHDDKT
jgi:hypothetical protein